MAARVGTGVEAIGEVGATSIASPSKSTTTGNLLVAVIKWEAAGLVLTGLSDTASNTWNIIRQNQYGAASPSGALAYAANITGNVSNVVTASFSASCTWRSIVVEEFSGLATSSVLDGSYTEQAGDAGNYSPADITTTKSGLVVMGVAEYNSISAPDGTAATPDFSVGAYNANALCFYLLSGSAQTVSPDASATDRRYWVAIAQAFKDADTQSNAPRVTRHLQNMMRG